MRVNFTQPPSMDGWSLSYWARNSSSGDLGVNSIVDVVQVFSTEPAVSMLQEQRVQMPPDTLPPESTYGNILDINALNDGVYSVYVMLDDEGEGEPTARLAITVEAGAVVSQVAD